MRSCLCLTILPPLGAPDWHGKIMNALTDSIVRGESDPVEASYTLRIRGNGDLPPGAAEELGWLKEDVADGLGEFQERHGRDVELLP